MNRCPKCNSITIKEIYWEGNTSILKDTCINPYCCKNKESNRKLDLFFKKVLGGKI